MVVQIIFGLIEHQRFVAVCQQEGQHGRRTLPGGSLTYGLKVLTIALAAVFHLQTVFGKPAQNVIDEFRALVGFRFQELIKPASKLRTPTTCLRQPLFLRP